MSIFHCPKNAFNVALHQILQTTTNADARTVAKAFIIDLALNKPVDEYNIISFITRTKPSLAA